MNEGWGTLRASYVRYKENSRGQITGGELLAWLRQQYGDLSQRKLADQVGASRSMIAQLESGTRQPSGDLLMALCQALHLPEVEQAMLFLSFGKVQSGQERMLPYVIAALHLDHHLEARQVEALSVLAAHAYDAAIGPLSDDA